MKILFTILLIYTFSSSCLKNDNKFSLSINKVKIQKLNRKKKVYSSFNKFWNSDMLEFFNDLGINNPIKHSFLFKNKEITQEIYLLDFALFINDKKLINNLKKHGAKRGCEILKTKCKDIKGDK